jgi:hypothetical protein
MSYKSSNFRSPKLLKAFKYAPICFSCEKDNDGTVVAAHANSSIYGKGMGLKAHDWAVAAMCSQCHHEIDQGAKLLKEAREQKWLSAHIKTIEWLFSSGILQVK